MTLGNIQYFNQKILINRRSKNTQKLTRNRISDYQVDPQTKIMSVKIQDKVKNKIITKTHFCFHLVPNFCIFLGLQLIKVI
ncbi:hypothetical protein BpHYR1_018723 [Brachionus plicatilis]|uniref:Uncharacterized protein n=1 Tax=Brachionus plicatilis TaxID=10195 RepID=A0A3M7S507_BRAPC|nr:hypothetical protein BpHYR1_018723 [Brachionus plicatilis]